MPIDRLAGTFFELRAGLIHKTREMFSPRTAGVLIVSHILFPVICALFATPLAILAKSEDSEALVALVARRALR